MANNTGTIAPQKIPLPKKDEAAQNNIVDFPGSEQVKNILEEEIKRKKVLAKEVKNLSNNYKELEKEGEKIEDFTAKAALMEIGLGLTSMLLEGKVNGDNSIYVINSGFELISNSTKSLPSPLKKMMIDGAQLLGMKLNEASEEVDPIENTDAESKKPEQTIDEIYENNREKILASYLKILSLFTMGLSTISFIGKNRKPASSEEIHPMKRITKIASSLIMAIPAFPMLGTYSAKHKFAEQMLKANPKDPNAEALELTANEDFLCFTEASFLGARKLLTSLVPKHENLMELVASFALSGLSFMNANNTLKDCDGLESNNFFKSELMSKKLPTMLYEGTRKVLNNIAGLELFSTERLQKIEEKILKSRKQILQYSS